MSNINELIYNILFEGNKLAQMALAGKVSAVGLQNATDQGMLKANATGKGGSQNPNLPNSSNIQTVGNIATQNGVDLTRAGQSDLGGDPLKAKQNLLNQSTDQQTDLKQYLLNKDHYSPQLTQQQQAYKDQLEANKQAYNNNVINAAFQQGLDNNFLSKFGSNQDSTASTGFTPNMTSSKAKPWQSPNNVDPNEVNSQQTGSNSQSTTAADSTAANPAADAQQSNINDLVAQNNLQRQIIDANLKEKQIGTGFGRFMKGVGAGVGGLGAGALGLLGLLLRNKALANAGLAGLAGGLYYGANTPSAWRQQRVDLANARMKSNELRQQATDAYGQEVADQMMKTGREVVSGKYGLNNTGDAGFNPLAS